jgi:hypothetical protein
LTLLSERGAMALRLLLLPFSRMRPDLDALAGKRSSVAGARTVPLISSG